MVRFGLALGAVLLCLCGVAAAARTPEAAGPAPASERLALIRQRGILIVGVKTDYPPFGALSGSGQPQGFEHDLAADIAKRLGVKLRKVGVTGTNRLQKLHEGAIDLVLATTGDSSERRKIATMVEPHYYASGVTLLMPPGGNAKVWADTRGKKVCATQGAYFNRAMQERHLLDLQIYNNARDAKMAVRDGRCIGFLFDNTAIINDLANPEWAGYKAPLPPALVTPWAIAIAYGERGSEFERILGDIVADWHRTGFLIEREKVWNIPPSKFLVESHQVWRRLDADGNPFCRRRADGSWNAECRNEIFLTSADVGGLARLGLWLNEHVGINLTPIYDRHDRSQFVRGLATTLLLTLLCISGSLAVGIAGAVAAESRIPLLAPLTRAGCAVGRMTPPLLVIYLVLFGVGSMHGISLSAIPVVVWCLSVYTGAGVMTALLAAAAAYRLDHPDYRLRFSNVRRLAKLSSGSVTAALINVSKATMMASAVAVPELLSASTSIISERGNVGVVMNALLLTFLLIIFSIVRLLRHVERRILATDA